MADKILAKASADEYARAEYQRRHKWYMDKVSSEKYLMMKGRKEGREEEKKIIARRLINKCLSVADIISITELSKEEIERICGENYK